MLRYKTDIVLHPICITTKHTPSPTQPPTHTHTLPYKPHSSPAFLLLWRLYTPIFQGINCICDCFQFHCHLVNHILSLRVDVVYAVFWCVQAVVRLPIHGIFNKCTDVNACDCTWRGGGKLYQHHKRICVESWLWEKGPLLHWRSYKHASTACRNLSSTNCATSLPPHPHSTSAPTSSTYLPQGQGARTENETDGCCCCCRCHSDRGGAGLNGGGWG